MARRLSQSDPALSIDFFISGYYTYRSQLFAPYKGIGVNVVSFHDPVIDGVNFELTDKLEWTRRPGFSIFCPIPLADNEIVNGFDSSRNLNGQVLDWVDTTTELALFTNTSLIQIVAKTTRSQGYISTIGNRTYYADGAALDLSVYDGLITAAWGLAAPTVTPTATGMGFWQSRTGFALGNTILDPNGSIESVTSILGGNGGVGTPTTFTTLPLGGGTGAWTGAIGSGQIISQSFTTPAYSNYLAFQTFVGLAIPSDATILGVVVSVPKLAIGGIVIDQSVKLVVGGSVVGTEHASGGAWSNASLTNMVYGSPIDTWGVSLTPSSFDNNFGFAIAANVENTSLFQLIQAGTSSTTYPVPTVQYTFPNPVTAGNTLVVCVCVFREAPINLSDSQGNVYTLAASVVSGQFVNAVYVCPNCAGGPTTVTMASGGGGAGNEFNCLNCHEFSGVVTVSPVEDTATNASPASPFNSGTVNLASATDMILSYVYVNGGSGAAPFGYTTATDTTFFAASGTQQLATAFFVPGASGNFSPTWSKGSLGISVVLKSAHTTTVEIGSGDPGPVVTVYYKEASGVGGPGISGTNEPIWPTTIGNSVNDGGLAWTNYGPIQTWYPATHFPIPSVILDTNGNLQIITSSPVLIEAWDPGENYGIGSVVSFGGAYWISTVSSNIGVAPNANYSVATTSGSTTTNVAWWAPTTNPIVTGDIAPVWNTNLGGFTTDGSYIWKNIGLGTGLAFMGYVYVWGFRTVYGHLTTSSPFSNNTGAILGPLNGSISGFTIAGDLITFTGNNNFQPGNIFTVGGMTVGTYLNGEVFQVVSAVPSSSFPLTAVAVSGSNVVTITAINNLVAGQTVTFNNVGVATFLNGLQLTVLSAGLSNTQFEANLTHASYGPTADTGTVLVEGSWTALTTFAAVGQTVDSGEAVPLIATISGVGTASPLCNSIATITQVSVLANIVTIIASNNFQPGLWVTFDGLTGATFLNGQQLQVISVDQLIGTQNTQFQVYFETPNYTATADTGTATFNAVEIYRTTDGGGLYLFCGAVTNPGAGVFWDFDDFVSDSSLDIELVAPLSHQNDPPPGAPGSTVSTVGTILTYWQGRLWMAVGHYVYFDTGPDCTNGIPEESWPPANRFQFAGPVIGLEPTPDGVGLLVYLADRVNAILGGPETISFYPTDFLSNFGISNTNAVFRDGAVIGQFTTQKQYMDLVGANKQDIGEHIGDYLSDNFASSASYVTMHRNGLDVGVFISNGIDRIVRFGSNIGAWSVPYFPNFGAGALRSVETSVGIYSLLLATPAGGKTISVGPYNPSSGISAGTGLAWQNPANIELGNPADYTTVTYTYTVPAHSQTLRASYVLPPIPVSAAIQGVTVTVVGKQTDITGALTLQITPTNGGSGATSHTFSFGNTNTTVVFGGPMDLWGMPWSRPCSFAPSFDIVATYEG